MPYHTISLELAFGIQKSQFKEKNKIALIGLLSTFTILNFDNNDAVAYGLIRVTLEKTGLNRIIYS